MAIPSVGGGYQVGDGNLNELTLEFTGVPQTATATATLTAAQVTGEMLVANPSASAAVYTLPTAAQIDAVVTNSKPGTFFDLYVVNIGTSSGTVTFATATGITDGGNAFVAFPITSSGVLRFRKTDTAAYTVYKVA